VAVTLRRFRRRSSRRWLVLGVVALLLASRVACDRRPAKRPPEVLPAPRETIAYEVERVIDGDTLQLQAADGDMPRHFRVRLMGIDCPETVHPEKPVQAWGPEASAFTRDFVHGRRVRIQFDRRRTDRYDRYLAYVYVDDRMLNEELVRAGLARVRTYPGDSMSMARRFRVAEKAAREKACGIWSNREETR
jgi:micrococcal nuclease